ncbi:MAG: glycosyltransferase family 39 protein [Chloroflexi bacterium]|nr:glycosyltransferase family 39 protein [Chloroflexota bacterium]
MVQTQRKRVVLIVLVVAWLFLVSINYYLIHKPFTLQSFAGAFRTFENLFAPTLGATLGALANVLGDALVVGVITLLAAALGHRLLASSFDSALEAMVMWTGIGLGAVGLLVFGLGLVGVVNQWIYWGLVAAALALLRNDVVALWRTQRAIALPRVTRDDKALALFCALALGVTLLLAFAPPWSWDSLQYHLIAPKLILQNGRIAPPPDNYSLNFPSLVEMLFLAGMALKGDGTAQALHWIFLPLTLGAMLAFAARYFSWRAGWRAAALLCTVPSLLLVATWAYNDLALTFYTFTAFVFAVRARETQALRDFVLAGILSGLAMGEKYTAGLAPVALAVITVQPNRAAIQKTLVMLASAVVIAAPWFLRNWAFVGNPFYPYGFGGMYWDSFRAAWNTRLGTGMWNQPLDLLMVPWTVTIHGTQSVLFDATLGPLLLLLLPLNLIPARIGNPNAPIRAMWYFAAVLYAVWLLGVAQSRVVWQTRLLYPAFPLFALLAALGWEKLASLELPQFSIRRFASLLVAFIVALTALSYVLALADDSVLRYIFGGMARDEYLSQRLGAHYRTAQWANANLPKDARLVFLWEPRTYYFQRDAQADALLDRFPHLSYLHDDSRKIAERLRGEGITHVVLYREGLDSILQTGFDPLTESDLQVLSAFVENELEPVSGGAALGLTTRNGRPGLTRAAEEPYAIYQIKTP